MNSRKWVGLFLKTLIIGGIAGLITSFFVKTDAYTRILDPIDLFQLLGVVLFFLGLGFVFSLISQTGFFVYLFINQFGLGFFRTFWPSVQMLLVAFVTFDLVYFPYNSADSEGPLFLYIIMSAAILVYGWIIAKVKAKQTNPNAFMPALFLMVVMTAVEWVPGLRTTGTDYAWLMIIPLLVCNTYQLLILHHLTHPEKNKAKKSKEA